MARGPVLGRPVRAGVRGSGFRPARRGAGREGRGAGRARYACVSPARSEMDPDEQAPRAETAEAGHDRRPTAHGRQTAGAEGRGRVGRAGRDVTVGTAEGGRLSGAPLFADAPAPRSRVSPARAPSEPGPGRGRGSACRGGRRADAAGLRASAGRPGSCPRPCSSPTPLAGTCDCTFTIRTKSPEVFCEGTKDVAPLCVVVRSFLPHWVGLRHLVPRLAATRHVDAGPEVRTRRRLGWPRSWTEGLGATPPTLYSGLGRTRLGAFLSDRQVG